MNRLKDERFKEQLTYNILKKFAKKKGWKEYRFEDGFYMFGPDDEDTQKGVEAKHQEWINKTHNHP